METITVFILLMQMNSPASPRQAASGFGWMRIAWLCAAGVLTCPGAKAQQTVFPFQIRIQEGSNVATVSNNSTVTVGADNLNQTVVLKVNLSYRGVTRVAFPQQPELFGSPDFQLVFPPPGEPIVLEPAQSLSFDIQFRPTTTNRVTAQFELQYVEAAPPGAPTGTQPVRGFITLNLVGTAPSIAVSYVLQQDQNVLALPPDSKLVFPPTIVNNTSQATIIITNRGSGPGPVSGVTVTGEAFQAQGLPLFPFTLGASESVRFNIRYAPKKIETSTGGMLVTTGDRTMQFTLEGTATGSNFSYEVLLDEGPLVIRPDDTFSLPDTPVGQRTSVAVRVRNTGNSDGPITSINLIGQGFLLTDAPFLPQTLTPNASLVFTLTFAPTQAGAASGRLRIGNDSFQVTSVGIGPQLSYSYSANGASPVSVVAGGTVLFRQTSIGEKDEVLFTVRNSGTAPAVITNAGTVEGTRGSYSLEGVPVLPRQLEPEGSLEFRVVFAPTAPGFITGNLRVDTVNFILSGSGNELPPLTGYRFTGASGEVQPLQQVSVGLEMVSAYPVALNGTLTLTVEGDLPADPAVQFSSGGRTVSFTVQANSTAVVFSGGTREVRLQTGTVASTIRFTPAFTTQSGVSLTPDPVVTHQITVPALAPRLLTFNVASRSQTSLTLAVSGFATTRSVSRLEFRFTPAADFNVPSTTVTVNVQADADAWFRGTSSQAFGGQFTMQVPFTLTSDQANTNPVNAIRSVSVTATNGLGTSNSMSVDVN